MKINEEQLAVLNKRFDTTKISSNEMNFDDYVYVYIYILIIYIIYIYIYYTFISFSLLLIIALNISFCKKFDPYTL